MERTSGIRRLLSSAAVYSFSQRAIGAESARRWLLDQLPPLDAIRTFVDIGCGPADMLRHLPPSVAYVGVDHSEAYVRQATAAFADRPRTTFITASSDALADDPRLRGADVVLFHGVLHHLNDDEALASLTVARQALSASGVVVALEPCYLLHQSRSARWLMQRDRGANIRTDDEWRRLMATVFSDSRTRVVTNLIRIPYVHVLLEGFQHADRGGGPQP